MIYFRLCFSFSCSGYDLTLIKKSHTLNFYLFFLLLVNVVAQFTAKTTNSEKAIYFLSLISCSISKLKSHFLFTCKSFTKILFSDLTWKKFFAPGNCRGLAPPSPALSPISLWHWVFYQENFNENLSFKQNVRGAAYHYFIDGTFAQKLLLNNLQQEQWLNPLV